MFDNGPVVPEKAVSSLDVPASLQSAIPPLPVLLRILLLAVLQGFGFGYFFERCHVFQPEAIREQFVFRKQMMLKMFVGAIAGSCLSLFLAVKVFWRRATVPVLPEGCGRTCSIKTSVPTEQTPASAAAFLYKLRTMVGLRPNSYPVIAVGAFVLGVGMAVSGACPGMVLPQMGTGVENCGFTLLGGVVGCILFNFLTFMGFTFGHRSLNSDEEVKAAHDVEFWDIRFKKTLRKFLLSSSEKTLNSSEEDALTVSLFLRLQLVLIFCCASFCLLLEIVFPFKDDLAPPLRSSAWPPSVAGFALGCLTLLGVLNYSQALGSTRAFDQVAQVIFPFGPATGGKLSLFSYVRRVNLSDLYQMPFMLGAILGAHTSQANRGFSYPTTAKGVTPASVSFVGGVLLLFGSKLGSGCTSGQGMGALPMLNTFGVVACAAMFGGGIFIGVILDAAGEYKL